MIPTLEIKLQGFYRCQVHDGATGLLKQDTGWFPNLITNQGMDWFGGGVPHLATSFNGPFLNSRVGVGTGNTTPAFTDTVLTSPLAMFPLNSAAGVSSYGVSYTAGPPPYWSAIWTYSFATGAVVGNVAELGTGGISAGTDTTPSLFSHALIVDGGGSPTTLPVLITDALTVTYELRQYLDVTDNTYSVSINGVTYTGTYRRAGVSSPLQFGQQLDYDTGGLSGAYYQVYNGTIGTVLQTPTGTAAGGPNNLTITTPGYTPGTLFKSFTGAAALSSCNVSGGISAVMFTTDLGNWQFSVSPIIPKDNTKTMSFTWNVSWARYP